MDSQETPPEKVSQGLSEDERRIRFRRISRWATALLCSMAVVYLGTHLLEVKGTWLGFVQAFAEAAVVGALADWFAVTALFRYPLGLRIPHTAIVPRKKDRIGDSLGRFVLTNFLSRETLSVRVAQYDFVGKGTSWLLDARNRDTLAAQLAAALPRLLALVDDRAAQTLLRENLDQQLRDVQVAPLAHSLLRSLVQGPQQQELLTEVIRIASVALLENKEALRERVRAESPWYIPRFVDNTLAERMVERTDAMLRELKREPDHPVRQKFGQVLEQFLLSLETSPEFASRMEEAKHRLLNSPQAEAYLEELWNRLKTRIVADVASESSEIRARLSELLLVFAERVQADPDLHTLLNQWLRDQLLELAEGQRTAVSQLIATTVKQWDRETVIEKLELQVGRDLQFIRINGTLVGGLVGLTLHTLEVLFS